MLQRLRHPLIAACVALAVSGCGTTFYNSQDVFNGTHIDYDKFKGLTYVTGLSMEMSMPGAFRSRSLVSVVRDNGEVMVTYIDYSEGGEGLHALFAEAHDADANALKMAPLDRTPGTRDAYPTESVAVYLPATYLAEHLEKGIEVRIDGRRGSQVVTFGPTYLQGYWAKLAIARACTKAKTC